MKPKIKFKIRKIKEKDKKWIKDFSIKKWGGEKVVSLKKIYYPVNLPGFIAVKDGKRIGLIAYRIASNECQIIILNSIVKRKGVGTALIEKIKKVAKKLKCKRLLVSTTNDNIDALRFYQKRGFNIRAVYPKSVMYVREKLKPEIPLIGNYGIPIRDEIELEIIL